MFAASGREIAVREKTPVMSATGNAVVIVVTVLMTGRTSGERAGKTGRTSRERAGKIGRTIGMTAGTTGVATGTGITEVVPLPEGLLSGPR
jgi:hypothetical protein